MSEQIGVILESDPVIVIDIRLGKELHPGQAVRVDYRNLRDTLDAVGAPGDSSELTITFASDNDNDMDGNRGEYNIGRKEITVAVEPDALDATQDTLEHEIQHYVDDLSGYFDNETWLHRKLYHTSRAAHRHEKKLNAVMVAPPVPAALISVYEMAKNQSHDSFSLECLVPAAVGIGTAMTIELGRSVLQSIYHRDPSEVRARRAEESIILPPTVTIA